MTNYEKGRQLEYEVATLFKNAGWNVIRGAGSKGDFAGFPTDLLATKKTGKYSKTISCVLIQAKQVSL